MYIVDGRCACEGVARGPAFVVDNRRVEITSGEIITARDEISRFWNAREMAKEQIRQLLHKANEQSSSVGSSIFEAYLLYIDDIEFKKGVEQLIVNENYDAKRAVLQVGRSYISHVSHMDNNPRIQARAADIEDMMYRVISCLDGEEISVESPEHPSIIVACDLTPGWFFSVDRDNILGFVLEKGAYNSHLAILARSMDIPMIINASGAVSKCRGARDLALYATRDELVVEPTDEKLDEIRAAIREDEVKKQSVSEFKGRETITRSGERIILYANVSSLEEIDLAIKNDAEGIGLFRTEYLYLMSKSLPTEDEQYRIYKEAISRVDGRVIVFRTADIGLDKMPSYMDAPYGMHGNNANRGIRFSMLNRDIFKTQLRAIYRAADIGTDNVSIMYPMICKTQELDWIDDVRREVESELRDEHIRYKAPSQGIVVETPAAVISADSLAKRVDFFSIGTNDLSQLIYAVDRLERSIDIEDFTGEAMQRVIEHIVAIGVKYGIPVGLCGDISSKKETLKWLIDAGIKGLSIQPRQILLFRKYIKEM